jgi:hypothetical protein
MMMKSTTRHLFLLSVLVTLIGFSAESFAQQYDRNTQQLLWRLDSHTNTFKTSLNRAFNRSQYTNTAAASEANRFVRDFETAVTRLKSRYSNRMVSSADVEEVTNRGWMIDSFLKTNQLGTMVDRDWQAVRADLRALTNTYNGSWRWDDTTYNPYPTNTENFPDQRLPQNRPGRFANRLTGTYTLDVGRSDNATTVIDRATRTMNSQDAQRIRLGLERRLQAPESLAIERNGRHITIVSSSAPQVEFDADGREQVETRNNGRTVRTTTSLRGDILTVTTSGDRGSDYTVSFEPIDFGRNLRVTRRFYSERLTQPVEVRSVYRKTDETAQWTVYTGERTNADYRPGYNRPGGSYTIPNNTSLTAVLNDDLSTRQTRDGDRFTMTVRSPSEYDGAVIEGTVSKVERSGRITGRPEMVLNFQNIRLRNGRTYEFAGFIDSVRTPNGESVKIDNEGSVRDTSQTTRTVTRSGIGAAIGAIIGGIAGGGQGAAIGAVVGAGAGAGTVIAQGREDITLTRGSEFTITTSAPQNDR